MRMRPSYGTLLEQALAQCQVMHHKDTLIAEDKLVSPVEAASGSVITSEYCNIIVHTYFLFPFIRSDPKTGLGIFSYTWISEHQFSQGRKDGLRAKAKAKART
jgi:hypothetical protein